MNRNDQPHDVHEPARRTPAAEVRGEGLRVDRVNEPTTGGDGDRDPAQGAVGGRRTRVQSR